MFDHWVGKIPWRRKWLLTAVFLPGEFQTEWPGRSRWSQRVRHNWAINTLFLITFTKFRLDNSQFSCSLVPNSLRSHGLQHTRLPSLSPTPRAYSNSCALSLWCHPTIASSVVSFSSHLQSFSAPGSFQMSQFFASGGQSTRVSASVSVLPVNIQDRFPLGLTDLITLQGTLKSLLQHHSSKASILWCSIFFIVQLSYPYMATGKTIALTRWTFVGKVMSLVLNMLSRLVIAFLPRSKYLLISWL